MNEIELKINQLLLDMHYQKERYKNRYKREDILCFSLLVEIPPSFIEIINERGQICSYVPQKRIYSLPVTSVSSF